MIPLLHKTAARTALGGFLERIFERIFEGILGKDF